MGFFTVVAAILILVPLALGYQAFIFINDNIIPLSIGFWLIMFGFASFIAKKEVKINERWCMYVAPINLLPLYCFVCLAVRDLARTSGFDILWAVFEIPFVGMVLLAIGLSIGLLFEKIKNGPLAAMLTVVANITVTCVMLSYCL